MSPLFPAAVTEWPSLEGCEQVIGKRRIKVAADPDSFLRSARPAANTRLEWDEASRRDTSFGDHNFRARRRLFDQ
jgi:hypothetical protein